MSNHHRKHHNDETQSPFLIVAHPGIAEDDLRAMVNAMGGLPTSTGEEMFPSGPRLGHCRVCGVYGEMTEEHLSSRGAAALPNVPSCNRLVSWAECRAKAVSPRTPTARLVRCRGTGRRHEARRRLPAQIV